jgi:hypothetical protein
MRIRILSVCLILIWFLIAVLQNLGVVDFGKSELPFSWIVYSITIWALFFTLDWRLKFVSDILKYLNLALLVDIVFYNLAIIYEWYAISPMVNRSEHFFGSLLVCFVIFALVRLNKDIKKFTPIIQSLIVIALANFLAVFNEIVELAFDHFFDTENIGPEKFDTNLDLLMNFCAFIVFGTSIILYLKVWRSRL